MDESTKKRLFDTVREIKGSTLTQEDVNAVNAVLNGETAPTGLRASQKAIDMIHDFEQFRANAYKDPGSSNGLPITIGWGSTRNADGSLIKLGDVWTREKADAQFRRDLEKTEAKVRSALQGSPATQSQFDALVSFAYNVGTDAMNQSTLMDKHRAGDYAGAKAQFARWNKNDGIVLAGLIRRRSAEAALYAS
jgi:lysozyme